MDVGDTPAPRFGKKMLVGWVGGAGALDAGGSLGVGELATLKFAR